MAKDNQHYVPQGYLRGFTIEGERSLIWEYDKNTGKISRQPKSVRGVFQGSCRLRLIYAALFFSSTTAGFSGLR
ncbi:DUF4238 domain-containing protein [Zhongshania guokunii]|uniref:DUF4238 domain-containing protein n=1 Tax=Zhongshania guokunii TaxID=641783 RepID=A0ABV3U638_9GAMM